ncbi:enabled-like protein [Perilla frutescens var. frutescens]|nr:enabled-like protein [Perilla frutescens var. frutescens]
MSVQSVLLTMELQQTRLRAEEDLKSRDDQIFQLKELLAAAIKDRDEARLNLKKALISLHQSAPHSGISTIDYDPTPPGNGIDGFSSSDCDESIVSSPVAIKGPLPEKGHLLQAVMKAGPLLQTLLLAGPLPQWRHPPPPVEIPPPPLISRR